MPWQKNLRAIFSVFLPLRRHPIAFLAEPRWPLPPQIVGAGPRPPPPPPPPAQPVSDPEQPPAARADIGL